MPVELRLLPGDPGVAELAAHRLLLNPRPGQGWVYWPSYLTRDLVKQGV